MAHQYFARATVYMVNRFLSPFDVIGSWLHRDYNRRLNITTSPTDRSHSAERESRASSRSSSVRLRIVFGSYLDRLRIVFSSSSDRPPIRTSSAEPCGRASSRSSSVRLRIVFGSLLDRLRIVFSSSSDRLRIKTSLWSSCLISSSNWFTVATVTVVTVKFATVTDATVTVATAYCTYLEWNSVSKMTPASNSKYLGTG